MSWSPTGAIELIKYHTFTIIVPWWYKNCIKFPFSYNARPLWFGSNCNNIMKNFLRQCLPCKATWITLSFGHYIFCFTRCVSIYQTEKSYIACHNKMNTCRKCAELKSNLHVNKCNWRNITMTLQFS